MFVIQSFSDEAVEDIYNGINSKRARKRLDTSLWRIACRKLDMLDAAYTLEDLRVPPSNQLEMLHGDLKGKYSIRINDPYRILFYWGNKGPEQVDIVDYH
jgi:toxin HigB-1